MRFGRGLASSLAVVCITTVVGTQAAYAAGAVNDGTCTVQQSSTDGHGCGGWFSLGCLGHDLSAATHFVEHAPGAVAHAADSVDWGRVGRDALAFGKGAAIGFAVGLAVTAGVALAVATFPAWGTAIVVGTVAVGLALTAVTAYQTYKSWGSLSEEDKFGLAGNVIGGLASGGVHPTEIPGVGALRDRAPGFRVGRYLSADEFLGGHPQPEGRVIYHGPEHTANVATMAKFLAQARGLSPADSEFVGQVGLLHDWDPLRTPGNPARVPATLKALDDDFSGAQPLVKGAQGSVLKSRFGWNAEQLAEAKAMIQRTEFPFDQPHPAYGGQSPSDVYANMVAKLPADRRAFVMREGAMLSEYADKGSFYYMNDFTGASRAVDGLANEISQVSGKPMTASALDTGSFMRSIGQDSSFATDRAIAAKLGVDVAFPGKSEVFSQLPPQYQFNFESNMARFDELNHATRQAASP